MKDVTRTYPLTLAGLYQIDFFNLRLKPLRLPNNRPSDYKITEIRFECGMGNAVFENGYVFTLNVKFDEIENSYTFKYREAHHVFEVKANLGGVCDKVDIMSLIDFSELAKTGA